VSYLLDTNVIIALSKHQPKVVREVRYRAASELCVSTVTMHELYFGAFGSVRTNEALQNIERVALPILDFSLEDARRAAECRVHLRRLGTPIGPYDVLIAGQALNRGLTLVTRNVREFARVEGLAVEDWESP
jgi:tRNA(fMet)-specific endonuclease VapC